MWDDHPGRTPILLFPTTGHRECCTLRVARAAEGRRVALAFTTAEHLAEIMGEGHPCVRLSESAARSMLAPIGVTEIRVDPELVLTTDRTVRAIA